LLRPMVGGGTADAGRPNQFDCIVVGHGISLVRWRLEHPHDMPPSAMALTQDTAWPFPTACGRPRWR
jgi:hypothetical protein